jgi:hypothetical protein
MKKLILGALALAGTWFILGTYYPQAWTKNFQAGQFHMSYGLICFGAVGAMLFMGKKGR